MMKFFKSIIFMMIFSGTAVTSTANAIEHNISAKQANKIAYDAYIYGYAIVENYKAIFGMSVYAKSPVYSGFNNFMHNRNLYGPEMKTVVSANNDTIYSTTFADLRHEPLVVTVPATGNRYFTIQLVDMLTDNFAYIGTRSTGNQGGTYLIVGPDFKGSVITEQFDSVIVSQAPFVALVTRTAVYGADDLKAAYKIQDGLKLTGYKRFTGKISTARTTTDQMPVFNPKLVYQAEGFYPLLNQLLAWQSPSADEVTMLKTFGRIDVGPYSEFDFKKMPAKIAMAIKAGATQAELDIIKKANNLGTTFNGWDYTPAMGTYGNNYLFRAAVAYKFIYTNSPEEAVYPIANIDGDGNGLKGSRQYVLHYEADNLPPIEKNGFWSLTMYDKTSRLMIVNPMQRYSIGDRNEGLKYGKDGSLTLYIQHNKPSADKLGNWLPAPAGDFYLIKRAYLPKPAFTNGQYRLPAIEVVH